jgi:hypothetical protein
MAIPIPNPNPNPNPHPSQVAQHDLMARHGRMGSQAAPETLGLGLGIGLP